MATANGRRVLAARRAKGRAKLTVADEGRHKFAFSSHSLQNIQKIRTSTGSDFLF